MYCPSRENWGFLPCFPTKIIRSLVATFSFSVVARSKLLFSGSQIQPLDFAWLHRALQLRGAKATAESAEPVPGLRGQGSFCWENLDSTSPVQEENTGPSGKPLTGDLFNPCLRFFREQPSGFLFKILYANRPSLWLIFFHQHIM